MTGRKSNALDDRVGPEVVVLTRQTNVWISRAAVARLDRRENERLPGAEPPGERVCRWQNPPVILTGRKAGPAGTWRHGQVSGRGRFTNRIGTAS
jgi:hypothetical protein